MAETYNDINLKSLVFNKVTNEEYRQMVQNGTIKDDEFYITPSELIDVPNIDSTTSGKYLTNDGTGALWSDVQSTNIVQDLSNPSADTVLSSQGVANESSRITTLMNTKVSNCITEIPQDIKLELNNGTLTLKAGSKVYVPSGKNSDGSNKFDVVTIASDKVWSSRNLDYPQQFVFLKPSQEFEAVGEAGGTVYSGATAPSGKQFMLWYDTTNNFIKWTTDSGSTWVSGCSFAVSICSSTQANNWASIDQVFNGFGYIGSTVFALPGVKGLIPNGRNADGSLKSIEFTLDTVKISTITRSKTLGFYVYISSSNFDTSEVTEYDEDKNVNYTTVNNIKNLCCCGSVVVDNNMKIISFTPKTVFHALDYNDKSTISGWSMPSSRYIDLSLAASGRIYTAPANGYFYLVKIVGDNDGYITFENTTKKITQEVLPKIPTRLTYVRMEAQKGDVFRIRYTASGDTKTFRFIYAEGEN